MTKTTNHGSSLHHSIYRKVRYETTQEGDFVTVLCHLPSGFTMREFTFMFNMKDAKEIKDFDKYIRDLMFSKLTERINNVKDRGFDLPEKAR